MNLGITAASLTQVETCALWRSTLHNKASRVAPVKVMTTWIEEKAGARKKAPRRTILKAAWPLPIYDGRCLKDSGVHNMVVLKCKQPPTSLFLLCPVLFL